MKHITPGNIVQHFDTRIYGFVLSVKNDETVTVLKLIPLPSHLLIPTSGNTYTWSTCDIYVAIPALNTLALLILSGKGDK